MDTKEIRTLCLKQVYGASLTEAERAEIDEYAQTEVGRDYMRECQEVKDLLKNVADVKIKPVDHEAMVDNFERTVRQKFNETVFQPWRQANSAFIILGILAALLIVVDGWNVIYAVLLGSCVLYVIADWFQRCYFAKILSRPDLYEYAKASRKRSDRILQSLPGMALVAVLAGLLIAAVLYVAYWSHREFGFIGLAIVILVLVETVAIFVYQNRKRKSSDPEVWDWWAEEIKE
ncbi:hypothetical protein [Rubinisphaera sp.]|uniref:hypothetical protein n=1 Tax=Rubinisphaera sp. TaxID=2024857 RepID=UPI000C119340|nr:hypothetical protein [Rubinisphaera sp.]MBV11611.1 hypothetical protein [Rubinisphaera sp.]HCS50031.1 hypothetical protein [Planctomycetaceae bacterium]|tara:strand:+ start:9814 stop:10512 length:699 start_codon:yes stop_codon:yes gene_type:complete